MHFHSNYTCTALVARVHDFFNHKMELYYFQLLFDDVSDPPPTIDTLDNSPVSERWGGVAVIYFSIQYYNICSPAHMSHDEVLQGS